MPRHASRPRYPVLIGITAILRASSGPAGPRSSRPARRPSSPGTRSPRTRSSAAARSRKKAGSTWHTRNAGLRRGRRDRRPVQPDAPKLAAPAAPTSTQRSSRQLRDAARLVPRRVGVARDRPTPTHRRDRPPARPKTDGLAVGHAAAQQILPMRTGDGRQTPIGTSSAFPTKTPGPGVWRLTPAAFAAPQTPWVGQVQPFVVPTAGPVHAAASAGAEQQGMGRGVQRGQVARPEHEHDPHGRADRRRGVLPRQRESPVQPSGPGPGGLEEPRQRRDRAPRRDGQRGRRRRRYLRHERQVHLPLLAAGHGDRPDRGHGGRLRPGAGLRRREPGDRPNRSDGGRSSRRRTIPNTRPRTPRSPQR